MQPDDYAIKVSKTFGRHACDYDDHSNIQRKVADRLITYCPDLDGAPKILEIGCGTGHLTQLLMDRYQDASFVITDINKDMLNACEAKCADNDCDAEFTTMNGEGLSSSIGGFDLIVSSMTVQWFNNASRSVESWVNKLSSSGIVVLSTLDESYFPQWRDAHRKSGVELSLIPAPKSPEQMTVDSLVFEENYANARGFLQHLKGTGASSSAQDSNVLSLRDLSKVMRSYDSNYEGEMTWHIAIGSWAP